MKKKGKAFIQPRQRATCNVTSEDYLAGTLARESYKNETVSVAVSVGQLEVCLIDLIIFKFNLNA
jgi:hypothetical protein